MRPLTFAALLLALAATPFAAAQDSSTAAIRGTVADATGARIAGATVTAQLANTGATRTATTNKAGEFVFQFLPPGRYTVRAEAPQMAPQVRSSVSAEVGATIQLDFTLRIGGPSETVTVTADASAIETQPSGLTTVIGENEIAEVPLNGRRWQDLALHTAGVTEDPRGLTSASTGDLAFGGVRGYHTTFLVDGVDNNNAFFAQGRGRYRAPYQFSNEVIQEFRVSSNTYGVEFGRSSGAVVNVVTKSGTNQLHGSLLYYLRSSQFAARNPFLTSKPPDQQHQFGFTLGGKLARNRAYFFGGFDQNIFRSPVSVRFLDNTAVLVPGPKDYEPSDQALVFAAAAQLTADQAGDFRSSLLGNAGFFKFDYTLSPRHSLSGRINVSRFYGANNVFFDPASPLTYRAISENGEEQVKTESASLALTSALRGSMISHLRVQFSRDLQTSSANTADVLTRIDQVIDGFGRSNILPRRTREHKLQFAETISLDTPRQSWKFGGDALFTRLENFFPLQAGGEYIFDTIRVNPFFFFPAVFGLRITPLRAYAHGVPRYYLQDFGTSVARPNTNEFSLFVQDNIRVTSHLAVTLGARYDLQTYSIDDLEPNPLWPGSGVVPVDGNNIAPRIAFAYSIGEKHPTVIRGGYGIFYTRIPQIYTSAVETDNGLKQSELFLDNAVAADHLLFPTYPAPLALCAPQAAQCVPPPSVAAKLTTQISTFARDFKTPYVQQASLTVEREFLWGTDLGVSYLYVHGTNLIRTRDVNLPPPQQLEYPVFDEAGAFTGTFFTVASFATWQQTPSFSCPFPPCINDVQRPIPQVGAIDQFESAVSSVYHGLTVSARHRMRGGLFFRLSYTWAKAMDDGQDAPFVAPPAVQNAAQPKLERSVSSIDQRSRFAVSWVWAPTPFHRDRPILKLLLNDWTVAGTVTYGSGRPFNARIVGDANRDTNSSNDRLPGVSRNSFYGPDYASADLRLTRRIFLHDRITVDALVESFNVLNHPNKRVEIGDNAFQNAAGDFIQGDTTVSNKVYPAQYVLRSGFLEPRNAYASRQVQFGLKLKF
ncbi:MAG: TonB-dependent receptor [Candidatus Koribacter versatilis]|uniref:TonB-dependent receptor n=1 Tax=Candidatus Korobacter versatilis TaxID=658062 RepID=A0A932EQX1_9BACT|nr:TonB-dependent receptor [Candidatus Koribacter versatilis]